MKSTLTWLAGAQNGIANIEQYKDEKNKEDG